MILLSAVFFFATSVQSGSEWKYVVQGSGRICYPNVELSSGPISSPEKCHQLAMNENKCYKGADAKANFYYNYRDGNNCACPTTNCNDKQYHSGYVVFTAVDANLAWVKNQYEDLGPGYCERKEMQSDSRGKRARYDYFSNLDKKMCKTSCDARLDCNGYMLNPNKQTGTCILFIDAYELTKPSKTSNSKRCFLKKKFTPPPAGPLYIKDANGNIIGKRMSSALETEKKALKQANKALLKALEALQ